MPEQSRHPHRAGRHAVRHGRSRFCAAVPLGVAAAVYLEEYASKNWLTEPDRDQHLQPRRRALDHLRPDGPVAVRATLLGLHKHASSSAA